MAKKEPSFLTQKLWWRIDGSMNWGELLRKQRVDSWMQKHNLNTFERLTETWMIWSPLVDRCVLITKSAPKKYMIKSFVFCTRPSHLYTVVAPNVMLVGVYIYMHCIIDYIHYLLIYQFYQLYQYINHKHQKSNILVNIYIYICPFYINSTLYIHAIYSPRYI